MDLMEKLRWQEKRSVDLKINQYKSPNQKYKPKKKTEGVAWGRNSTSQ